MLFQFQSAEKMNNEGLITSRLATSNHFNELIMSAPLAIKSTKCIEVLMATDYYSPGYNE
jgi:hypothetical protein